jgi:hypothetical protein
VSLPSFLAARSGLRLQLVSRSDPALGTVLCSFLTPSIAEVLCWTDPEEAEIVLLGHGALESWHCSLDDAYAIARLNLDRLLAATPLPIHRSGGAPLAFPDTDSAFKAALLRAPSLRERLGADLGWPARAIAPARDFLLLVPDDDRLTARLAAMAVQEHEGSTFPVSRELLRVSDDALLALGEFRAEG